MLKRFIKLILIIPLMLGGIVYYVLTPLWYILFNKGLEDTLFDLEDFKDKIEEW